MAKKKPATKKTAKKTAKKAAGSTASKKVAAKKATSKKGVTKKPAAVKKKAASGSSKTAKTTKTTKTSAAKASNKAATKAASSKPSPTSKTTTKKAAAAAAKKESESSKKPAAAEKPQAAAKNAGSQANAASGKKTDGKPARKGITIVENRSRKKKAESKFQPPPSTLGSLLSNRRRQPLIPSGPNAPASEFSTFGDDADASASSKKVKSPFKKKELDAFRGILLAKRRELAGDVEEMERGMASLGDRGGDPALDVAEQGSDAYDQSLSIGLAEADRKLIREIDEALRRIDEGVYGVCEVTREPISTQRLNELPWTRLSIEAARDAERRGGAR
ncbi:MAG: TraR/DksA family transcriptional regulator [Planctomycetota bacterium]